MTKLVNPTIHGVLDYVLAVAFLLLPAMLDFPGTAATLSYIFGAVYLAASLLTAYPLGAFQLIPFPVHGVLESIMAAFWVLCPWLFGFAAASAARNFFVIAGIGLLLVAALTDYRGKETRKSFAGAERRRSAAERRQRTMPVARDRRLAGSERRGGGYAAA
jgi:hypothetical protein